VQRKSSLVGPVHLDDRVLARFQRVVEVRHHNYAVSASNGLERAPQFGCEIDQHQPNVLLVGGILDLGEAMGSRRIHANDQAKIKNKEAAIRLTREQRFHHLIEPVGRAEEQVALQRHALKLFAVRGQD
jgi:hypothetical protein